nr:cell division protein FtsZ [Alistipes sp.]
AVESLPEIRQHLEESGTRMLFITAGMGGGTGTGASPVIAKLAKEMGLLTVAIVTSPLAVEGKIRYEQAFRGIEELRQNVDSLLIINNENILEIYGRLSLKQAFGKADDILCSAAKGIAEIITVESDLVNVDFADVSKVMRDSGRAHMAVATAEGDNRAEAAAEASLRSPLLDHNLISGAKNILLNISVADADGLMYEEVVRILEYIQAHASVQDDNGVIHNANIIWGTSEKPQLGNAIELVVVATGFAGDVSAAGTMKQIIPPVRSVEPAKDPVALVLEPIKPVVPPKAAVQRPPEQVMLGAKSTRYSNIELLLSKPAYQSRNSKFVVQMPGGRKEVLKEENDAGQQAQQDAQGGSLFD